MTKALVLVNGEVFQPEILERRIREGGFDLVLGADRGALHAKTLKISLDAIVGDLDSISDQERRELCCDRVVSHAAEKDETDLELALLYARDQGAGHIVMVGAMGGRLDMAVSNILMLNHPALYANRVEVWHGSQTGWIIRPPGEDIAGCSGDTLSLLPLAGDISSISVAGLKYPLRHERLFFGQGRGLSNVLLGTSAIVRISEGLLLAVHTPGRA
ncbi:MAG: thiamine diphosphokinase [Dehalococcoidales bacterium]|nr:thiamine diphosphokinase [Dehalococcoidales bacterium]